MYPYVSQATQNRVALIFMKGMNSEMKMIHLSLT